MHSYMLIFIIVNAIIALPILVFLYLLMKSTRLPKNRPSEYLKQKHEDDDRVVVLAGDSLTHGKVGVGYIPFIAPKFDDEGYTLVNAGVNSHLAWNLFTRLDEVIRCNPKIITILIGTNDANATTSKKEEKRYRRLMRLPRVPDHAWFRENLRTIVARLQAETSAQIALLSIPTIGEQFDHPAFLLSLRYGSTIREIAEETGAIYLPLQEQMVSYLRDNPGLPVYPFEKTLMQMYKGIVKRHLLGKSWDTIAADSGFRLHTDYLHLNSVGAKMVADLILSLIKQDED